MVDLQDEGIAFDRHLDRHVGALRVHRGCLGNARDRLAAGYDFDPPRPVGAQGPSLGNVDIEAEGLGAALRAKLVEDLDPARDRGDQHVGVGQDLGVEDVLVAEAPRLLQRGPFLGDLDDLFFTDLDGPRGGVRDRHVHESVFGLEPFGRLLETEIDFLQVPALGLGAQRDFRVEDGAVTTLFHGAGGRVLAPREELGVAEVTGGVRVQALQLRDERVGEESFGVSGRKLGEGGERGLPLLLGLRACQPFLPFGLFLFGLFDPGRHLQGSRKLIGIDFRGSRQNLLGLDRWVVGQNRRGHTGHQQQGEPDHRTCTAEHASKPHGLSPAHRAPIGFVVGVALADSRWGGILIARRRVSILSF
ncbi:MAG: hypothetical protein M3Y75_02485 [Actinomycetota bacterium]|nr:hypothetical protein [Actinomycetota bacterium]